MMVRLRKVYGERYGGMQPARVVINRFMEEADMTKRRKRSYRNSLRAKDIKTRFDWLRKERTEQKARADIMEKTEVSPIVAQEELRVAAVRTMLVTQSEEGVKSPLTESAVMRIVDEYYLVLDAFHNRHQTGQDHQTLGMGQRRGHCPWQKECIRKRHALCLTQLKRGLSCLVAFEKSGIQKSSYVRGLICCLLSYMMADKPMNLLDTRGDRMIEEWCQQMK